MRENHIWKLFPAVLNDRSGGSAGWLSVAPGDGAVSVVIG